MAERMVNVASAVIDILTVRRERGKRMAWPSMGDGLSGRSDLTLRSATATHLGSSSKESWRNGDASAFPGLFRDAGTCRNHLQGTFGPMINQTADSGQGVSDPREHRFHPKPRLTQGRRPGGLRPRPARDIGRHLARPRRLPREQVRLVRQTRRRPFRPPPGAGLAPCHHPAPGREQASSDPLALEGPGRPRRISPSEEHETLLPLRPPWTAARHGTLCERRFHPAREVRP